MEPENDRSISFGKEAVSKQSDSNFRRSVAVVIGIDDYANNISRLSTAVSDAKRLAAILRRFHGYQVKLLTRDVTRDRLIRLLEQDIQVTKHDRLLFYFAGHGVALDGDDGPQGFLIPQDARADDRDSFLPMTTLHGALEALDCRHMLAILDCCFAGTFRWSSGTRNIQRLPEKVHKESYERYKRYNAWQVLTSAAYDQKALDILSGDVGRHVEGAGSHHKHSPFALALFKGLTGSDADLVPKGGNGIVTAAELHLHLRQSVEGAAEHHANHQQTPQIWPLKKHDKGEYFFLVPPGREPNLPPAPELTEDLNPYRGLKAFEIGDRDLFFGRSEMIDSLAKLIADEPLMIVLGVSGSGKSSLVNAGLIPRLDSPVESSLPDGKNTARAGKALLWRTLPPIRPGAAPMVSLMHHLNEQLVEADTDSATGRIEPNEKDPSALIADWCTNHPQKRLLLVIDQFEEVLTLCHDDLQRAQYITQLVGILSTGHDNMRVILTLRLDFEPMVRDLWPDGHWTDTSCFTVTPMNDNQLREAIERPASERVLYFEPASLVQCLIGDIQHAPAALPLLSFTLSELYRLRDKDNRTLTKRHYDKLGGVIGSLRQRANEEYDGLGQEQRATMQRLMLRMVAFEGGELTRRRVHESELIYSDSNENANVKRVLKQLIQARLIVPGRSENPWGRRERYWEPAHDKLIVAWDRLLRWYADTAESLPLQRRITQAAGEWAHADDTNEKSGLLWDKDPRLPLTRTLVTEELVSTLKGGNASPRNQSLESRLLSGMRSIVADYCRTLFPNLEFPPGQFTFNQLESQFIRESIRHKRDKLRRMSGTIATTISVLLALTGFAFWQKSLAEQEKREASRQLGATQWNNAIRERDGDSPKVAHYLAKASQAFATAEDSESVKDTGISLKFILDKVRLRVVLGYPERVMCSRRSITGARFRALYSTSVEAG